VTDQVLLSASHRNIEDCVRLAESHQLGVELMTFAFPDVLDGGWESLLPQYRALLQRVPGKLALHGPFMDMAPGSPDRRINQLCLERYHQAITIAAELDIHLVIFHANFIAAIHNLEYRDGWHNRNVAFWTTVAQWAEEYDLTVAVENMWEFDPDIIGDLLKEIAHPNLRACLDIGHAYLFGEVPFEEWLTTLNSLIVHTHMNNNDGKIDIHMGFDHGVLNYRQVLPQIRALPVPPSMTLEMDEIDFMRASLHYMELESRLSRRVTSNP
jgi:sugar phosphate isomerase/epimerase